MLALGVIVNTGSPANIKLPAFHGQSRQAQAELTAAGDTLEKVALWKGTELYASTSLDFTADSSTTASDTASADKESDAQTPVKALAVKKAVAVHVAVSSSEVEQAVRSYFADIPVMVKIAECESHFRQYDSQGEVLHGNVNYADRGVMQINEAYHRTEALKLGFDILTLQGNMEFARHLYEEQGTQPWISSAACWAASDDSQIAQN